MLKAGRGKVWLSGELAKKVVNVGGWLVSGVRVRSCLDGWLGSPRFSNGNIVCICPTKYQVGSSIAGSISAGGWHHEQRMGMVGGGRGSVDRLVMPMDNTATPAFQAITR